MKLQLFGGVLIATTMAAAAHAQTLPTEKYPYVSGPVTITSCSVNENSSNSTVSANSLRINYYANQPGRKLTSVTFRVRYAQTPVTVTDTGTFEEKQQISHPFNLLGGLPWTGANPTVCRVLTATFADGQVVNPPYEGPDAVMSPAAAPGAMTPGAPMTPPDTSMPANPPPPAPAAAPTST